MTRKISAASQRAFTYPNRDSRWFCGFAYTPVTGIGYEEGIHRRDPSSVIRVGDLYYVYYTKSIGVYFGMSQQGHPDFRLFPWDQADIWYAASPDGIHWTERDCAVARGPRGSFDDRTVCTPDVLAHEGKYYLVYQTQQYASTYTGISENVGMAIADSPDGPWQKVDHPILEPMEAGDWFGESDSYNAGHFWGVTHDPMLLYYRGHFWLYHKCSAWRAPGPQPLLQHRYAGPDTRWGVARADHPTGPYEHSEYNPITNSGHETLLWLYDGGVAALLNRDGPEKNTIQYARDGINFEIMAHVENTPQAGGAFRCSDTDAFPLKGIQWGLCHVDERGSLWNYILRFDADPRMSYTHPLAYPSANNSFIF
ncbi:MAG: glycosyl hydrolase, partial [Chloroflexi bacterium]